MTYDNLITLANKQELSNKSILAKRYKKRYSFSESSLYNLFLFRKTYKYVLSSRWPDCLEGTTRYNQKFVISLNDDPNFIRLYSKDIFSHGFGLQPLNKDQTEEIILDNSDKVLKAFQHRDQSDYIYSRTEFLQASGKKYQKHRYHINKTQRNYNVLPELISESNVTGVRQCLYFWKKQFNLGFEMDYSECLEGIDMVLEGILKGYCIFLNGKVESFIIYDDSLLDMSVALFQKTNHNFQGLTDYCYKVYCENDTTSTYFNLCQDLGIPGLRRKKLMMHPITILDKYLVLPV